MKLKHGLALLTALIVGLLAGITRAFQLLFEPMGLTDALNNQGTHEGGLITRITEEAFSSGNLLCKKGTAARQILIGTATARPLGVIADTAAITTDIGVILLGGADSVLMIASGVIGVDAPVYTDAAGKVSATAASGSYLVGTALSATTADGQEIEVLSCFPMPVTTPAITVSAVDATVSALQANAGIIVSNAGASGAATFALPAATVGMRVSAVVEAAQELRLDPNGTETIALPSTGVQGAAGKYLTANAIGESVEMVCLTAGTWDNTGFIGTWTAEG